MKWREIKRWYLLRKFQRPSLKRKKSVSDHAKEVEAGHLQGGEEGILHLIAAIDISNEVKEETKGTIVEILRVLIVKITGVNEVAEGGHLLHIVNHQVKENI